MKEGNTVIGEGVRGLEEGGTSSKKRLEGALGSKSEENHEGRGKKQRFDAEMAHAADGTKNAGDASSGAAAAAAAAATVVVDLSYDDLMNDKESASLATQVNDFVSNCVLVPSPHKHYYQTPVDTVCTITHHLQLDNFAHATKPQTPNAFCSTTSGYQRIRFQQT